MIHQSPIKTLVGFFIFLCLCTFGSGCVPRCTKLPPYVQCKVRMRHVHSGTEYRGVPIWRKQHLQYGQKVKRKPRQDPHHKVRSPKNRKKGSRRRIIIRNH